ncbi:MAG TPA: hypothetical protein DCE42_25465 [Myxococcales bacterium]|nr:hypothetical protein [Deltaproteobacteria bacterium]HAA58137.1 hypothetical protein [Myxococcales bacterium]
MKRVCVVSLLTLCLALGWFGACSPPESSEKVAEKTAEVVKESVKEKVTEATAEPIQDTSETPDAAVEPSSEPSVEPGLEAPIDQGVESVGEKSAEPTQEPVADVSGVDGGSEGVPENLEQTPETMGEKVVEMMPDTPPKKTFTWAGAVFDFFTPNNPPVGGVKVCVYQKPAISCSTTGTAAGKFSLAGLSVDTDYHVTFEKSGMTPIVVPIRVPASSLDGNGHFTHRVGMLSEQTAKQVAIGMGVSQIDLVNKAHVVADVHDGQQNPASGVGVSMSPMSGQGPFYITSSGTKNPTPQTSSAGIAVFFNVTPGTTYEFSYSHSSKTCKSWPTTISDATGVRSKGLALKGFLLVTSGLCQ